METVPFENAEEAFFWFMTAQAAKNDGARCIGGCGKILRPCKPIDILKAIDALYRGKEIMMDHALVLRHYGRKLMAPDRYRDKERRAHMLWHEAMEKLEAVLQRKGIVAVPQGWGR
ncbi:MAG: hypothetical protein GC149_20430 [Gammaproteobacteria bacterium]|nr:hypothetical protein [Gammaproteobacteria bacterium]